MQEMSKEFIDSEIKAIIKDTGVETFDSKDSIMMAVEWINKNAAEFRDKWNKQHRLTDPSRLN